MLTVNPHYTQNPLNERYRLVTTLTRATTSGLMQKKCRPDRAAHILDSERHQSVTSRRKKNALLTYILRERLPRLSCRLIRLAFIRAHVATLVVLILARTREAPLIGLQQMAISIRATIRIASINRRTVREQR